MYDSMVLIGAQAVIWGALPQGATCGAGLVFFLL